MIIITILIRIKKVMYLNIKKKIVLKKIIKEKILKVKEKMVMKNMCVIVIKKRI